MKALSLLLLALLFSMLGACASRHRGSSRTYEGDSSPHLHMYEENPGGPLGR